MTRKALLHVGLLFVLGCAPLFSSDSAPLTTTLPGRSGPRLLRYPPRHPIQHQGSRRFDLPNGMVLYLAEDHELPLVTFSFRVRVGSRWEPSDKAGVSELLGRVMSTGGTPSLSGDDLQRELDRTGAVLETWIGQDMGTLYLSVLAEHAARGLSLAAGLLRHSTFPQDKIDEAKVAMCDAVARQNDSPQEIAFREFSRLLHGSGSPYTRKPDLASIAMLARQDVQEFFVRYYQPQNIAVGVWGDFRTDDMLARLQRTFSAWQKGGQPAPPIPAVTAGAPPGLYSIDRKDVTQSWILIGGLGGKRDDSDYGALEVMNRILGGDMSSRLATLLRSKKGLAYSTWSSWNAGWDRRGTFEVVASTGTENTADVVQLLKKEIQRLTESEVSAAELQDAKDRILNGLIFDSESIDRVLSRQMTFDYFGYPKDYSSRYEKGFEQLNPGDILQAARKHLKPESMIILIVGDETRYRSALSRIGPVQTVPVGP